MIFLKLNFIIGLSLPLLGTALGSGCVFFMKNKFSSTVQRALTGFAAGVMVAASIWSLLIPAMDYSVRLGRLAFVPCVFGFWLGVLFLLILDHSIPHIHFFSSRAEGRKSRLERTTMLVFAVALHNLPEGMAVGAVYSALLAGDNSVSMSSALALALGIAVQNFPEGAVISLPLKANGASKKKAFVFGVLSGAIEPLGAAATIALSSLIVPILPVLLSFAAGAMIYVVVEELIPEMSTGRHSDVGTLLFALGFTLMMALDVALA